MQCRFERALPVVIGSLFMIPLMILASPGAGYLFNNFTRGTSTKNRINQRAETEDWDVHLKVSGATDFVQQDVALAPGGFSGWHSHPGPVLITVKSGTVTWYNATDPACAPVIYPEGSAFFEPAGVNHFVSNRGSTNLELVNTYIIPKGAPTRAEEAQPSQCSF